MCVLRKHTHCLAGLSHQWFLPCRHHTVIFFLWGQCESCLGDRVEAEQCGKEASQGGVTACCHQFGVNDAVILPNTELMCLATTSWASMEFTEQEIRCQEKHSQASRRGPLPAEFAAHAGAIRSFLEFASCWVAGRLIEERLSAHIVPEASTSQNAALSI